MSQTSLSAELLGLTDSKEAPDQTPKP